jgi:hypothetical protein
MPDAATLWRWKNENEDFCNRSARAREASAQIYADEAESETNCLKSEAHARLQTGEDFPKGVVEAFKVVIQEKRREAALRNDALFGDRKHVRHEGADGGAIKVEQKQSYDLSVLSAEQLDELEDLLYGSDSAGSEPTGN